MGYLNLTFFSTTISRSVLIFMLYALGKELDLSIVISPKEGFESIRKKMHFISVAELLRLSIDTIPK